jgi:predicted GNAT family acetyltransferase
VIEGVFTDPRARGQGVAAGLVAAVCLRELRAGARRVALHVDCDNAPARACYARAGMREVCESGLLLRDG